VSEKELEERFPGEQRQDLRLLQASLEKAAAAGGHAAVKDEPATADLQLDLAVTHRAAAGVPDAERGE